MMAMTPELWRALGALCEAPTPEHARIAEALGLVGVPTREAYIDTFAMNAYPYASVYVGAEGMLGGEAADRVAGFWRAVGLTPPPEPDHLAALLGLAAGLAAREGRTDDPARAALARQARHALLWEHLLSWVPPFLQAVTATSPAYRPWADLVEAVLREEAEALGPPATLPAHLRAAPGPVGPEAGLEAFVAGLLVPVRTGMILTRADLGRALRTLDLGGRVGSRASVLRSVLEQDPRRGLDWLAGEADRWAGAHRAARPWLGPVAQFWEERADAAAARLREWVAAAREVVHAAGS
jgi:hypothetical protein